MIVKVKKLWHGMCSVRDYLVEETRSRGQDLTIVFGDKNMLVKNADISKGTTNGHVFVSIHDNKKYKLIDFLWKPTINQLNLI